MFKRILIANRSEIAVRIIRTARRLGIETVAVYSDADADAMHVKHADKAIHIGPSAVSESYLRGDTLIQAAITSGAQAIHPGYGFLSENADFVDDVNAAGLTFIGPSANAIRAMGLKDAAKTLMQKAGVPVVPGYHGGDQDPVMLANEAARIGYPVLIKARAGGGGKGMRLVHNPEQFSEALDSAAREGDASFGDAAVLIEKYITQPRHIEVQLFGDNHGNVVHLFERDCSLQRRHQKVIEEAPAPGMTEVMRSAMTEAAITAARAINYSGAGTIEFIVDGSGPLSVDGFWFMEMNTRLQVEHPVTEMITGIDLVEVQLRVACDEFLPFDQNDLFIKGHALEARVYAEDVVSGFLPATGKIHHFDLESSARIDTGVSSGDTITPFYDPMIAKVIVHGETRPDALHNMRRALAGTHVAGTVTNIDFLQALVRHEEFEQGVFDTGLIERHLTQLCSKSSPGSLPRLLAAIVFCDIDSDDSFTGWRMFGSASHLIQLVYQQQEYRHRIVLLNQASLQLQPEFDEEILCQIQLLGRSATSLEFTVDGYRQSARVFQWNEASGSKVSVVINGENYVFENPDNLAGAAQNTSELDALIAPMTGVVRLLDVSVGQMVNEGDRLMVMEAMKMETSLVAPRSGMIDLIACSVGDSVEGGSVLMRLQNSADDTPDVD